MRKSLLDFPSSRLKKRLLNEFYLGSFFSVSHAWYMFWTLLLTEQVVGIYKNSHQRVVRGNLFTFCMYITSLPWSTLYPKSVFLSIMNHFHIHWTLKLLFRLRIKNAFLRQQIWKTKAYAQYLHSCKIFFCRYEENPPPSQEWKAYEKLICSFIIHTDKARKLWGLKCYYQT